VNIGWYKLSARAEAMSRDVIQLEVTSLTGRNAYTAYCRYNT